MPNKGLNIFFQGMEIINYITSPKKNQKKTEKYCIQHVKLSMSVKDTSFLQHKIYLFKPMKHTFLK